MGFSDKLKLIIDVDAKGAISGLSGLKTKMGEAEGFFGKLKVGAGGLGDMFRDLGPAGKAGLAASGIGAVGTVAFEAVSKFADLGLSVGEFRDKTGLSAEESSRWIEVAGDMGVDADTLATTMGKLSKNIDPAKFKELGIEIAYAKDGTIDANATFLNAVDALDRTKDSADRAKLGAELFGKGWASISEIASAGADGLREKLSAVADVKVLDDSDIEDARKFRDTMDDLKDVGEEVALRLGKALLPAVTALGEAASDAAEDIGPLVDGLAKVIELVQNIPPVVKIAFEAPVNPIAAIKDAFGLATEAIDTNAMSLGELNATIRESGVDADYAAQLIKAWHEANDVAAGGIAVLAGAALGLTENVDDLAVSTEDQVAAAKSAEAGNRTYVDLLNEEAAAAKSAAAGILEQANAARSATDAGFAAADAQDTFLEKLAGFDEVAKEAKGDTRELDAAYRDVASSAADVADATVRVYEETATANGTTLTATEKQDAWNASMLDSAATAKGELRNSILTYIGSVNQIPPEKVSEIQALIDQGKLAEAKAALEGASKTREADIVADAKTAQAERDLQALARDRTANILVRAIAVGASVGSQFGLAGNAKGGPVRKGEVSLVGEEGPEIVQFGSDGTVYTANETRQMMSAGGGGGGSVGGGGATQVVNNYVTIHTREMPTPRELDEWISRNRRLGFRAA